VRKKKSIDWFIFDMNKNTNYVVKNINGTSEERYKDQNCNCKTWIGHWRNNTSSDRQTCCVIGCNKSVQVGAHVQIKDQRVGDTWFIAPFCKTCNNYHNTSEMFIDSRVTLVPVSKQDDCKK
jgi:hypothetical protein